MAIEIREITIRTEVKTVKQREDHKAEERDLYLLKEQLMEECRRLIDQGTRKRQYKR